MRGLDKIILLTPILFSSCVGKFLRVQVSNDQWQVCKTICGRPGLYSTGVDLWNGDRTCHCRDRRVFRYEAMDIDHDNYNINYRSD